MCRHVCVCDVITKKQSLTEVLRKLIFLLHAIEVMWDRNKVNFKPMHRMQSAFRLCLACLHHNLKKSWLVHEKEKEKKT